MITRKPGSPMEKPLLRLDVRDQRRSVTCAGSPAAWRFYPHPVTVPQVRSSLESRPVTARTARGRWSCEAGSCDSALDDRGVPGFQVTCCTTVSVTGISFSSTACPYLPHECAQLRNRVRAIPILRRGELTNCIARNSLTNRPSHAISDALGLRATTFRERPTASVAIIDRR